MKNSSFVDSSVKGDFSEGTWWFPNGAVFQNVSVGLGFCTTVTCTISNIIVLLLLLVFTLIYERKAAFRGLKLRCSIRRY